MALQLIDNQPVILNPEIPCKDCDTRCFCQQYAVDDYLYWQAKQEPCKYLEPCPEFEYSDELVENIGPSDDGPDGCNDWTIPAGWSCSEDGICHTPGTSNALSASLSPSTNASFTGGIYRVLLSIRNRTAGAVILRFPSEIDSDPIDANGDLMEFLIPVYSGGDSQLDIIPTSDFDGCVYFLSVKEVTNWAWEDPNHGYTFKGNCTFCGGGGDTIISLENYSLGILAGHYYVIKIRVTGSSNTTVNINPIGNTVVGPGVHEIYFTPSENKLRIQITTEFGCVEILSIGELKNNYAAAILDEDNSFVADITSSINYYKDWITIAEKWSNLISGQYGCYKLAIYNDCCTDCVPDEECGGLCNLDFSESEDNPYTVCWEQDTSGNVDSHISTFLIPGVWDIFFNDSFGAIATIKQEVRDFCQKRRYRISFDYDSALQFQYYGQLTNFIDNMPTSAAASEILPAGADTVTFDLTVCGEFDTPFYFALSISNPGGGTGEIQIDNLSFKILAVDTAQDCPDYVSNCLCYKEEAGDCERLIQGYCDNAAFGFEFANTGFRLSQRLVSTIDKPYSDEEVSEYVFSNGVRDESFAQIEPWETLFIEQVDAITHASIRTTRRCSHFLIERNGTLTEHKAKKGDYQPEWVKDNYLKLAPSRFDVSKKGTIITRTNCS